MMSNIKPNCDGSHCRHGYKEVRKYPLGNNGSLYLCLPCFADENMHRHNRTKETGKPEDWQQVSWSAAELVFDKHGEPWLRTTTDTPSPDQSPGTTTGWVLPGEQK
jgi:hypothetical protein